MDYARNFLAGLPPPAESLAILVGLAEVSIFGLTGFANAGDWTERYGLGALLTRRRTLSDAPNQLTAAEEETAAKQQTGLVHAIAARNLQNGILMLTFACYLRDRRALGVATLLNAVTTIADAFIVRAHGLPAAATGHLVGLGNSVLIGGSLLYWGRDDKLW